MNNNIIVHKTQNKLPEPKYLATKISISIASSRTFVKTMVTLENQVSSNPGKRIQMNIDNIFYIIKSAIISVPSNIWQRSYRTTLHSRQSQFIRFNPGYGRVITMSLNSTQRVSMDAGVKTARSILHLVSIAYQYYNQLISRTNHFHNNYVLFR